MVDQKTLDRIVIELVYDMEDRKGLGDVWDSIDEEVKKEIKEEWAQIIQDILMMLD